MPITCPEPPVAHTGPDIPADFHSDRELWLRYRTIYSNATVGIGFTRDRVFQHCNPAFEEMFGWPPGGMIGQSGAVVWRNEEVYREIGRTFGPQMLRGEAVLFEHEMVKRDGTPMWARCRAQPVDPEDPIGSGTMWVVEDESERNLALLKLQQLKDELEIRVQERTAELASTNEQLQKEVAERLEAEERARHLSLHDALTGLPNRRLLSDRLQAAFAQAKRGGWKVAVLYIDLDRFKQINDTLGHHIGDELLREISRRLKANLRDSDTVARVGGDEFVVLLPNVAMPANVVPVANKLLTSLSKTIYAEGNELHTTPSIGVSLFPDDGTEVDQILTNADAAMYHVKTHGRGNFKFYASTMNDLAGEKHRIEQGLRKALERNELCLYYQPRLELKSGKVHGYEALLRWHHPEDGVLQPDVFIPIAEETGLIIPIGNWVLEEACRQLQRWDQEGYQVNTISVNLSARQLADRTLIERVEQTLKASKLEPSRLELEITETVLMKNTEETYKVLASLRQLGV
ncbi:MAG: diguanylate cyclase, partial [Betaproteobacteria bacterium]|nr:diguanylate cyclase [Betaproteobacteria bacterium]